MLTIERRVLIARELQRVLVDLAGLIDPENHDYTQGWCQPEREWREYARQFSVTIEEALAE